MKKGLAVFLVVLLMASMIVIPMPSLALDYGVDSDLSNVNASFWGEDADDRSGLSIASAGDVNGDGYDDILIGAPYDDDGGASAGQTYLVLGKASGWAMDTDLSNVDASFWGEDAGDSSGISVAGAGDVNGDSYDDILIGAYGNEDGGSNAGQTYLILGKAAGWAMDTDLSNADASFWGEHANDNSGYSMAGAGDVNGDGYDDILIGAYLDDDSGDINAGQTYLIFGKAAGWAMDTDLSNADASFFGEDSLDYSGVSVAGAGDVNGDGYDDILIGAHGDDDGGNSAGQTYLVLGKDSGWAMDTDLSNANASFLGEDANDYSGYLVAGAGDVNGDGYDDILIGAYGDDAGGGSAGQTYLIMGKASGWSMDTDLSGVDASFWGEDAGDYSGRWVAGAEDINGDGYDDILIGAYGDDDGGADAGQTYLILGKAAGWSIDTDLSIADASFWGEDASDYSGYSVAGGGDVNGDGYDDILIGAYLDDDGGANAGQTYLIFPDFNSKPTSINSVKAYSDSSFSTEIGMADVNDTVFIELQGIDGNSSRKDIACVNVTSNESSPLGFRLRLIESGLNTGKYRGNFSLKNRTNEDYQWINASDGETINISSIKNPSKYTILFVGNDLTLFPLEDNGLAQEDELYIEHYFILGWTGVTWVFDTNASWLDWNSTTHNISGVPDNDHVGTCWVNINISNGLGGFDEHNFTITVNNTAPDIDATDVTTAIEDERYSVDYNSTDDGQGTITWYLETDAGDWLSINSTTGILNGTPTNDNIGQYFVNVSVDDGNDGWNSTNFTLTVQNTNDPPIITTEDNGTAYENSTYIVDYRATDIDPGDSLTWYFKTDADSWLSFDSPTGNLSGTPENEDVGIYWVNVSVVDVLGALDHHNFTLEVINTNDPPEIISTPIEEATALEKYTYQVNATDIDIGDTLSYSLDIKPLNMTIGVDTGLIEWIPTKEQVGKNRVVLRVFDGNVSVSQTYNITVIMPGSSPPKTTLLTPAEGSEIDITTPVLSWSWEDPDTETVHFDVYLNEVETLVSSKDITARVTVNITDTNYIAGFGLERSMIYYWTVIPYDGVNYGECLDGVWWFKVSDEAVLNREPVISSTPVAKGYVGIQYQYDVEASDADGDILTYSLLERPDGMIIDAETGLIIWTPAGGQVGNHSVTVRVTDSKVTVSHSFKIEVIKDAPVINNKPVITQIPDRTIKAGDDFIYQVAASDVDAGDILTYKLDSPPDGLTITSTGLISWTPDKDQTGEHTITVNVSDGKDYSIAHFKITVEKKATTPGSGGLDATMLGIIAAIIIAVMVALVAVVALRGRKKEEPEEVAEEDEEEEEPEEPPEEPPEPPKEAPVVEEKAEPEEPEEKPEAELEDEIDLDDLEDED